MDVCMSRTIQNPATTAPVMPGTSRSGATAVAGLMVVSGWTLAISLAAQVRVPVPGTDVPMTLQALAVLLTGYFLSPGRAVAASLLYLACGACGLPVFSPSSTGFAGPTAGYLVGFVAAAWLVSTLRGPRPSAYARLLVAGACGMGAVFAFGMVWRLPMLGGDVAAAVWTGVIPFLPKAAVEVLLAASLVRVIRGLGPAGGGQVSGRGPRN
jgi:biotin transport system substrate-specific component